ncbi:hypothetical protein AMTR_s00131p00078100 [Amborella trichopoda]|uniref:Protein kinase domain-containing protein n=1 Tax=Amborella trichopoda TaxID=13333 RepID=W1NUZ5_AMBTC|nr:hypothetical protein AMTR_s00131p00078100 [Amborella trichopoda]
MAAYDPNSSTNFTEAFYRQLGQSSHMSANNAMSLQTNDRAAPIVTTGVDNIIGSNTFRVTMFMAHEHISGNPSNTQGHNIVQARDHGHSSSSDNLASALMDDNHPVEGLRHFKEWTLDLRNLQMCIPFARGAFGHLYRATYNGEEVVVKIIERPNDDRERSN